MFLQKLNLDKSIFEKEIEPYDKVTYPDALKLMLSRMQDGKWYYTKDLVTPYVDQKSAKSQFLKWCIRNHKLIFKQGESGLRMFRKP